jgi:hypothetical protein
MMQSWRFLLGGMLVWTAHFFGAYILASIFPDRIIVARVLAALLTLACLAALVWLIRRSLAAARRGQDDLSSWTGWVATLLGAIAFIAVLWQAFPILFVSH